MTWFGSGSGVVWEWGMVGVGRVPCGCTGRTVDAFLGEFLVCARAGVDKRNARTHEFL